MAKLIYSLGEIDRAGSVIADENAERERRDSAVNVVDYWRREHAGPLIDVALDLHSRAKAINGQAIIAERLKRLPSIQAKLARGTQMRLSRMNDIAGCRAILPSVDDIRQIADSYRKPADPGTSQVSDVDDYVQNPKADGYTGIHVILKYASKNQGRQKRHGGLRVEVQLRSQLQHAWATAVEVFEMFSKQAMKSPIKTADQGWQRFFCVDGNSNCRSRRTAVDTWHAFFGC